MLDLLIIGAGLTGLTAALTAASAGLKVKVIAKGMGALHWSAATIDLLAYPPGSAQAIPDPWDAMTTLPFTHPYAIAGVPQVQRALDTFAAWTAAAGLPYTGYDPPGQNLMLPSAVGAMRPVYLAPAGQRAGDLSDIRPILVVGFHGLNDFFPALLAENLGKQGVQARHVLLPWELLTSRHTANAVHLAEEMDKPERHQALAKAIKAVVAPGERVGLPAILGHRAHVQVLAALEATIGAPVFEIPTLPPSVPGIRLVDALRRRLGELGVRVEVGMEAIAFEAADGAIRWVETATSARPLRHTAHNFLLATGGVLGGGFSSDHSGRFWETVFNLPLTVPQDRRQWFRPLFLDPAGQPVFQGGVAVDGQFQPLDATGKLVYRNLWVAGGALAGADPIQERSLEGIAVVTGMAAAVAAERQGNKEITG